jgi:hypothetical protein
MELKKQRSVDANVPALLQTATPLHFAGGRQRPEVVAETVIGMSVALGEVVVEPYL